MKLRRVSISHPTSEPLGCAHRTTLFWRQHAPRPYLAQQSICASLYPLSPAAPRHCSRVISRNGQPETRRPHNRWWPIRDMGTAGCRAPRFPDRLEVCVPCDRQPFHLTVRVIYRPCDPPLRYLSQSMSNGTHAHKRSEGANAKPRRKESQPRDLSTHLARGLSDSRLLASLNHHSPADGIATKIE